MDVLYLRFTCDPASQFTTVHDRLGEHPNPVIGHYLDKPDNAVAIKDYFRTFEIAEALAKHDVAWRTQLTPAFQAIGPLLDALFEEAQNRTLNNTLDIRWGMLIKSLRNVIERYLRNSPKKDSGSGEKQGDDTKQQQEKPDSNVPPKGKKKIIRRIKSSDDAQREETPPSLKGEDDEGRISGEEVVPGNAKPVVTAEARVNGSVFSDVNQTARVGANVDQPTLIADRVAAKSLKSGKELPNGNMGTAHAEVGAIQQAFEAGATKGADMTLTVTGKAVCGFCRGDVASMAEQSGLKSLTVFEEATGNTLYWQPGMKSLRKVK